MALKIHGIDTAFYVNGVDVSNQFSSADIAQTADNAEGTGYNERWRTFVPGMKSGSFRLGGFIDANPTGLTTTLEDMLGGTANPISSLLLRPTTFLGGYSMLARAVSHQQSSPIGGIASLSLEHVADGKVSPTRTVFARSSLTPTVAGATIGPYFGGTATTRGAIGFAHFLSVNGNPVVTIRHSANGTTGWTTLISFAAQAAPGAQRGAVTGTVQPFISVTVTGGTADIWVGLDQPLA